MHRIGRTGRVGRSGRAITFVEPRQKAELTAIEEHIGIGVSPWIEGAHVAPARGRGEAAPPHQAAASPATATSRSSRSSPRPAAPTGIEVADLVHTVTDAAGLDGEAVRDVRVLERFSLLAVPAAEAERITAALKDRRLEVEPARN